MRLVPQLVCSRVDSPALDDVIVRDHSHDAGVPGTQDAQRGHDQRHDRVAGLSKDDADGSEAAPEPTTRAGPGRPPTSRARDDLDVLASGGQIVITIRAWWAEELGRWRFQSI